MVRRLSFVLIFVLVLALAALPVSAQPPGAVLNGGGQGLLTDPDGNTFDTQFSFSGVVSAGGTARGNINFVFTGEMADYWGTFPGIVDMFHAFGQVTGGTVDAAGNVTLTGTVTEYDFDNGNGVVFYETNVPFVLVAGPSLGDNVFTLQYCELPTFTIQVTSGSLAIQSTGATHAQSAHALAASACGR
jgi:hypothetical protein